MKLGDKQIKTGLENARHVRAFSTTEKIEERIRREIIEKYGKILSPYEIQQITGREKERQEKRTDSLERSRVKILKMKDKARLIQDIRCAVQEGTLFKRRKKPKGEVKEIASTAIEEKTEEPTETIQPSEEQEEQAPPESSEEASQETEPEGGKDEEKKDKTKSKPNIKPVDFNY